MASKKGSVIYQTKKRFRELSAIGKSKPINGTKQIHSIQTMRTYLRHSLNFVTWCRDRYNVKELSDCKPYIKQYVEENNYSPWTKKTIRSALCKMYGINAKDLPPIDTGERARDNINRGRCETVRSKHFSETGKYKNYVEFCKSTGLRKSEIESLLGTDLKNKDGKYYLRVVKNTKGGRIRELPIINNIDLVKNICEQAGKNKVIQYLTENKIKAPNGANTHGYRSEYAKALYNMNKRPIEEIPSNEKYYCRNDLKGVILDKKAMAIVSQALGHTRLNIIAQSYLYRGN